MPQTIQQERAAFALRAIEEIVTQLEDKDKEKYKSYASALPFMIHANGLGQAAAFCKSKEEPIYEKLYKLLSDWLIQPGQPYAGCTDLLAGITSRDRDMKTYLAAQAEAMAFMTWVKQFADAFMEG